MSKLEEYYIITYGDQLMMPMFSELSEAEKAEIEGSIGFAFFKVASALFELAESVKSIFPVWQKKQ